MTLLEEQMQELRELAARVAGVELQILQLRDEVRDGLFAIRDEVHGIRDELRAEIRAGDLWPVEADRLTSRPPRSHLPETKGTVCCPHR